MPHGLIMAVNKYWVCHIGTKCVTKCVMSILIVGNGVPVRTFVFRFEV